MRVGMAISFFSTRGKPSPDIEHEYYLLRS
jgi:hypothetical protein